MKPEARVACQVTMAVLFVALLVTAIAFAAQAFQPRPKPCSQCPFDWIGYRGKCYYFLEVQQNWTSSQDNCSALGASLAMLDSLEDLVEKFKHPRSTSNQENSFVMRHGGTSERWIGLSREDEEQPWEWVNHSRLSLPVHVRGGGLCAYLDDSGLSSSHCSAEKSRVCNTPALQSPGKSREARRAPNLCISS